MKKLFVREIYTEETLDNAMEKLQKLAAPSESIAEALEQIGVDKDTLLLTAEKGMVEYIDGLIELKHAWNPKMMSGTHEEKAKIYGELHGILQRMDDFSEPYISAMRLMADCMLRQAYSVRAEAPLMQAKEYPGAQYHFDEAMIEVDALGSTYKTSEEKEPNSVGEVYRQIAGKFMRLKDLLNLMEDATTPEVYEHVSNTNEFPEARIGKCFEAAYEIEKTRGELKESYRSLLARKNISEKEKKSAKESLKLLNGSERGRLTKLTQDYAEFQFNEKGWKWAYRGSMASLVASVAGASYSLRPFLEGIDPSANEAALFFAGAVWTIASGLGVYFSTDAGPKTAKWLRKVDEKFVEYKGV